jgi:hypothetical protein
LRADSNAEEVVRVSRIILGGQLPGNEETTSGIATRAPDAPYGPSD